MPKMLVLQGVPASGKSTFARELASRDHSYVIVNRDSIRESRGDYWIPEQEDYISAIEEFSINDAISRGLNVIIDATNLNPKTIEKWKQMATKLNCDIEFKLFEIEYKEALARDAQRTRPVGEKVLKRFFKDYFPEKLISFTDTRPIRVPDVSASQVILCDIDGTVALRNGRSPYDYSKVKEDTFDPRMNLLLSSLAEKFTIIFLSGRQGTEQCRKDTEEWLKGNLGLSEVNLIMRKECDFRPDDVVKDELFKEHIEGKYNVVCVFDDRDRVVKMWRDKGILCNQVYYGDF